MKWFGSGAAVCRLMWEVVVMVDFRELPLGSKLWEMLDGLEIDFALQPIVRAKTLETAGYEALMRPEGMSPSELIRQYRERDRLHVIEVATVIGATKVYLDKGLSGFLSVNSLPSECFTAEESEVYFRCFPNLAERIYVEILEYSDFKLDKWLTKREQIRGHGMRVAIDDYGTGNNFMLAVNLFEPDIVKIDRRLVAGIEKEVAKQAHFLKLLDRFHGRGILVLAEGVETAGELDFLRKTEVDYLQGFYIGRPEI